jgi:hypothetical protein
VADRDGGEPLRSLKVAEQDRMPLRWQPNILRTVAWLKAPSDEEDHASFQLDVIWPGGQERLPEVYALERSNPVFEDVLRTLETALASRLRVTVIQKGPGPLGTIRPDGTATVGTVVLRPVKQTRSNSMSHVTEICPMADGFQFRLSHTGEHAAKAIALYPPALAPLIQRIVLGATSLHHARVSPWSEVDPDRGTAGAAC